MAELSRISTDRIAAPRGHYSQATRSGGLLFVSGQLPFRPDGTPLQGATVEEQTRTCLANLRAIVEAGGSAMDRIARVTVYVSDVALWPRVNETYAEVFGDHRPARTVVPSGKLHHGFDVEIDAIAIV
jgi:reactive intermediate/imine deaminase